MLSAPAQSAWEAHKGEYTISTDPSRLNMDVVHGYLARAFWSEDIPRDTVERAVRNSLCFALFEGAQQVGFARVVTDYATFAWICDVFVLESHRGRGLAKWLMQSVVGHPNLQGLRRWHLTTRDAHDLYRKVGFVPLSKPERHMEIFTYEMYKRHKSSS